MIFADRRPWWLRWYVRFVNPSYGVPEHMDEDWQRE